MSPTQGCKDESTEPIGEHACAYPHDDECVTKSNRTIDGRVRVSQKTYTHTHTHTLTHEQTHIYMVMHLQVHTHTCAYIGTQVNKREHENETAGHADKHNCCIIHRAIHSVRCCALWCSALWYVSCCAVLR